MPTTTDPLYRLNQLDAARAAGTPGTWATYWGDHIGSNVTVTGPGSVTVDYDVCEMQDEDDRVCTDNKLNPAAVADDASLIVTAVNALPQLTGALRAVLELHTMTDRGGTGPQCAGCATHITFTTWPCKTVTALTAALEATA